jgi:hypothetical protein
MVPRRSLIDSADPKPTALLAAPNAPKSAKIRIVSRCFSFWRRVSWYCCFWVSRLLTWVVLASIAASVALSLASSDVISAFRVDTRPSS